ncbi:MAG: hypothetical protein ACI9DC_002666 [Gammaproteobacteria bacterium]|jgi:hypothetical protein
MGPIQHPQLRDLIWAVSSPSLITPRRGWPRAFDYVPTAKTLYRLEHTDTQLLDQHLARCETRFLGSYFEALWEFFFVHDPRFNVVAKNLQIHDAHRTLGEFDFIVFDRQANKHLHLELAVKFYLGVSETNTHPYTDGENLWIGPQARDRLDIKIARVLGHQLTLHQQPLAQQQLRVLGVDTLEPQLLIKGYLFQPQTALPLPNYVRNTSEHAQWIGLEQLSTVLNDQYPWHLLHKRHWLAPPYAENLNNPLSAGELGKQLSCIIKQENRPYLIAQSDGRTSSRQVLKRYFVTPCGWPHSLSYQS